MEETTVPGGNGTLDGPLVALVNEGTGPSAQIVAGAPKENVRARLVGERSSDIGAVIEADILGSGPTILLIVA